MAQTQAQRASAKEARLQRRQAQNPHLPRACVAKPNVDIVLMADIVFSLTVARDLPVVCRACLEGGVGTVIALLPTLGARRCCKELGGAMRRLQRGMEEQGFSGGTGAEGGVVVPSAEALAAYTLDVGGEAVGRAARSAGDEGFRVFIWRRTGDDDDGGGVES